MLKNLTIGYSSIMATKGSAVHTDNLSVACTPELKSRAVAAAAARGVNFSIVVRWALEDWLAVHSDENTEEGEQ